MHQNGNWFPQPSLLDVFVGVWHRPHIRSNHCAWALLLHYLVHMHIKGWFDDTLFSTVSTHCSVASRTRTTGQRSMLPCHHLPQSLWLLARPASRSADQPFGAGLQMQPWITLSCGEPAEAQLAEAAFISAFVTAERVHHLVESNCKPMGGACAFMG